MWRLFPLLVVVSGMFVQGCRTNSITEPGPPPGQTERGVFVVNEGLFPNAGSIWFYNISKDVITQNVVAPSVGWITPNDARVIGNKLYVVVNGGNTIFVRNADTFQAIDSIAMPVNSSPGFLWIEDSTKAYVANYNGTVSLLNLTTRTVVQTSVPVVVFPGGIVTNSGRVYVSDFGFYPGIKNIVKVLDGNTLAVLDSVLVGPGAGAMVSGPNRVYVVSSGEFPNKGKVFAINTGTNQAVDSITISDAPSDIGLRNESLFVLHSDRVMKLGTNPLTVSDSAFVRLSNALFFYAMQIDNQNGDVYVARIVSNGGAGEVAIYSPAGALKRAPFSVGTFPGAFAFK